jgi:CubicO group peptidase (beta-lactamase class C family)
VEARPRRECKSVLETWKVPANTFTEKTKVTLRALLTHTAGMTVHGFPVSFRRCAAHRGAGAEWGEAGQHSPILVDTIPGTNWRYSGFVVTQLLLKDVTGQAFPTLMHDIVLGPIGMTRSTYEQPLPRNRIAEAAMPYRQNSQPVPGGPHVYPEMAPAGLWTTPSDLAKFPLFAESETTFFPKVVDAEIEFPRGAIRRDRRVG